jgi:AcrR family transcriptional regulator
VPRAGLSREAVTALAVELVDSAPDGWHDLTLAAVAARAGVAVPSLYKHVGSLGELRRSVTLVAVTELGRRSVAATVGRSGADAVRALGHAIRTFAHERPGLYAASQAAVPTHLDDPVSAELDRATGDVVGFAMSVLQGFEIPEGGIVDATRTLRAAIHGFVALEAAGGFGMPDDVDRSFDALLEVLVVGLGALSQPLDSRR